MSDTSLMGNYANPDQKQKQPWELEEPKTDEERLTKARRYSNNEMWDDAWKVLRDMDPKANSANKVYKELWLLVNQKVGLL